MVTQKSNINILATVPLKEELAHQITSIDSRIRLSSIVDLMTAEQSGNEDARRKLDAELSKAEIIFGFNLPSDLIRRAPGLKWIQLISAGVDRYLTDEVRNSRVTMTSVRGMHAVTISEFVLCEMLMFAKHMPQLFLEKQSRQWKPVTPNVLRGKTVGIVGMGGIGRETARLCRAFGMKVMATYRSARSTSRAKYVDEVYQTGSMTDMFRQCDFVVLSLPLTHETKGMIGEHELRSMKPTAYLINISRGRIVDEEALVRALEEGRIAGAGLDVFETEPLPVDSRLWGFPNVILSPHIAGGMDDYIEQSTEIFCENLKRYISGKRLLRMVNKQEGY